MNFDENAQMWAQKVKKKYFQNAKRGRFSMKKHQCECKKSESYKEMRKA